MIRFAFRLLVSAGSVWLAVAVGQSSPPSSWLMLFLLLSLWLLSLWWRALWALLRDRRDGHRASRPARLDRGLSALWLDRPGRRGRLSSHEGPVDGSLQQQRLARSRRGSGRVVVPVRVVPVSPARGWRLQKRRR